MDIIELLVKHPTFNSHKENFTITYSGTIIVNADSYKVVVKEVSTDQGKQFELIDKYGCLQKFKEQMEILKQQKAANILSYVDYIEKIIKEHGHFPKNQCFLHRKVLHEYMEFTKFFIDLKSCSLSKDLTSIKASSCDEKRREHKVEFGVDFKESKDTFYLKNYDLPISKNKILEKKSSSLLDLYNIFLGYIEGLQPYFDLMDIIDANSYVIDPSDRLRKYNFRRIWLQENVCVIITIDPFSVNTCPHFAFLGPDRLVNEFRSELNKNLEEWNNSGDIFAEILQVLGIEKFPGKSYMSEHCTTELLKEDSDCSICFCSDLNGKLPEIVCNNKCCENFYHKDCLYEWLLSINSKKVFNEIQGSCPNCEKMISCTIPD